MYNFLSPNNKDICTPPIRLKEIKDPNDPHLLGVTVLDNVAHNIFTAYIFHLS